MIQELLGANSSLLSENRKIPIFEPTPNPNTTTTTNSSTPNPNPNPNPNNQTATSTENLRCPRCDSSNTKFCYYNNYNLTQPRHFCKTCRRYWTKGGALRNVPIGGGCRKNKPASVHTSTGKPTGSTKLKTLGLEIRRSSYGFDQFSSSPFLFGSPQSPHLFNLVRVSQNPNPDLGRSFGVKEEGSEVGNLNHLNMSEMTVVPGGHALGFDPQAQNPLNLGFCPPIWKNSQQNGFISELTHQNSGIQDLYQRLRSSSMNSFNLENPPLVLSSVACSSSSSLASTSNSNLSSSSTILESSPVGEAELGNWNPTFSWSELPATNGAYP